MKQSIINDVVQEMLPFLNNAQLEKLQSVLKAKLAYYDFKESELKQDNSIDYVNLFLSAKRIEGCSEKSLAYYESTIVAMLQKVGKDIKHIETDDIRNYCLPK